MRRVVNCFDPSHWFRSFGIEHVLSMAFKACSGLFSILWNAALVIACLFCLSLRVYASDEGNVVILVNRDDPDSLAIGEYYAKSRNIPLSNIVSISAPLEETISLRDYVDRVHNPVLDALLDRGWISGVKSKEADQYGRERMLVAVHSIRFLVTTKGVPLRFENAPELIVKDRANVPKQYQVNRASVDSELALLAGPQELSMTAFIPNPYFGNDSVSPVDSNRIIKLSRLDGPSRTSVFRLIDRSIEAEKIGLMGRAYVDSGGPHLRGDQWFEEVRDLLESAHFDTDFEPSKRLLGYEDRLDVPAIYMGWYSEHAYGPWLHLRRSVPPGAIGFHLHSFSATTVRSTERGWLGPLIERGFCATFGNVYEPYLELTHRPQVFLEHLLDGGNFGDAVMKANPALSWQTVALGDPLYRPFRSNLDRQLAMMRDSPLAPYVIIRELKQLLADGVDEEVVLARGRSVFSESPSLPLALHFAEICLSFGRVEESVSVLKLIKYIGSVSDEEKMLAARIGDLLSEAGETELGFAVYEMLLSDKMMPIELRLALLEAGVPVAKEAGRISTASRWDLELRRAKIAE